MESLDFAGWLILKVFAWGGFVLEYWRWFLGGVLVFLCIFVLPEKLRHTANAITKMMDAVYLLLGRVTRYILVTLVVVVVIYGLYQIGDWRKVPEDPKQTPTMQTK